MRSLTEPGSVTRATDDGTATEVSWTLLDRSEIVDAYWETVAPAFAADGHDPETERPSHEWLADNDFRGLVYALREYHDRSFGEFWADDLGLTTEPDGYDWGTDHAETVARLESFVDSRRERGGLAESSVRTARYRLSDYVEAYVAVNDTGDLLSPVAPDSDTPDHEAVEAAWNAVDRLDRELADRTTRRVFEAVDRWYDYLRLRRRVRLNPVTGVDREYNWSRDDGETPSNPALSAAHVGRLYEATDDPAERLLVVALCAWGLRSGEVAALHRDQIDLAGVSVAGADETGGTTSDDDAGTTAADGGRATVDRDDDGEGDDDTDTVPAVTFDSRKNGPGRVSILYGLDAVTDRIETLSAERDDWNGYLFPSKRSQTGHRTRQTILARFDRLAERAGLPAEIGGRKPVPQMARRFWYDQFAATREEILSSVGEIAAEQGSASAEVVLEEYLSPERRRRLRREGMRDRLAAAFDGGTDDAGDDAN